MREKVNIILDQRKFEALRKANQNLEIAMQIEGFKKAYADFQALKIGKQKALVYQTQFSEQELTQAKEKVEKLLKTKNLTLEDLTPKFTCPHCQDTGYIAGNRCKCAKELETELNNQNLNNIFHTFADHKPEIFDNDKVPKIYTKLEKWAQSQQKNYYNLLLVGGTGCGKTFLAECLASELIKQNKKVCFKTAFALNQEFWKFHTALDKPDNLSEIYQSDVLIIDDLGSESMIKNVTKEYFYLILNERYLNQKITITTTNLGPDEIFDHYGERVNSRLVDKKSSIMLNMENSDLRLKKQ